MNKLSLLAATTLVALSVTSIAHADSSGAFVQAGAGRATESGNGRFSYTISGGYRWALSPSFALGVEGGYADLGHISNGYSESFGFADGSGNHTYSMSGRIRTNTKAALLGANAKWDINDTYYLMLRGGYGRYRVHASTTSYLTIDGTSSHGNFRSSYNENGYYAGAGFGMHVLPHLDLQVTYDHYAPRYSRYGYHRTESINAWNAGVEYRF